MTTLRAAHVRHEIKTVGEVIVKEVSRIGWERGLMATGWTTARYSVETQKTWTGREQDMNDVD